MTWWKLKSFLRALLSVLWRGFTRDRTRAARWRACHLNGLGQQCPDLKVGRGGYEFCDGCGCPQWWLSRLMVKYMLPGATCPRGKWVN